MHSNLVLRDEIETLAVEGVPPEVFFVLPFATPCPRGTVHFHPAFLADGPQQG